MTWVIVYVLGSLVAAWYIWTDGEFREIDRNVLAVAAVLAWPLVLPWYLLTRPPSIVQDMGYEKSHQHYRDYVKQKGRDIGEGVTQDLARREEEARLEQERKEKMRSGTGMSSGTAFDVGEDEDLYGRGKTVVIGGEAPAAPPAAGWGNIPGETPAKPDSNAPRQSYGTTGQFQSIRAKLYGDEGHAFEDASSEPAPQQSAPQSSASQQSGGWSLEAAAAQTGDGELPIPGSQPEPEPYVDRNIERLMAEGQLREAHQVARRMLEMATKLGETGRQAAYQRYFQELERRIAASEVPLED